MICWPERSLSERSPEEDAMRRIGVTNAWATVLAAGLVLAACGSGEDEAEQSAGDLRGRAFTATAVTENGEPRALVPGTRIQVSFGEGEDWPIGWKAGCNSLFGTDAEITADRLVVREIGGTAIGCRHGLAEQEVWLDGFFDSDPEWRLSGDRLTLISGESAIELEEGARLAE
jgi:heat shock protein HslJ